MGNPKPLTELLHEKNLNLACPSCGRENWLLPRETAYVTFSAEALDEPGDTHMNEALVLICGYCGFMRFHRASVLRGQIGEA